MSWKKRRGSRAILRCSADVRAKLPKRKGNKVLRDSIGVRQSRQAWQPDEVEGSKGRLQQSVKINELCIVTAVDIVKGTPNASEMVGVWDRRPA